MSVFVGGGGGGDPYLPDTIVWRWPVPLSFGTLGPSVGDTTTWTAGQLAGIEGLASGVPDHYAGPDPVVGLVGGSPGMQQEGSSGTMSQAIRDMTWAPMGYPVGGTLSGAVAIESSGHTNPLNCPRCGIIRSDQTATLPRDAGGVWVWRQTGTGWILATSLGAGAYVAQEIVGGGSQAVLIWDAVSAAGPGQPATISGRIVTATNDREWGPFPWDGVTLPELPVPVTGGTVPPPATPYALSWRQESPIALQRVTTAGRVVWTPHP